MGVISKGVQRHVKSIKKLRHVDGYLTDQMKEEDLNFEGLILKTITRSAY
jgi:hypothetical protein